MAWIFLVAAGLCDTLWSTLLKKYGMDKPLIVAMGLLVSLGAPLFMGMALKSLPLGTAFVTAVSIAVMGTFLTGIFLFHESASIIRVLCVALILAGIIGLKLTENSTPQV